MARFKVLHISNDLDEYPECTKDAGNHPDLVKWVEDEYQIFIYNESTGDAYPANEFFSTASEIEEFTTGNTVQQVEDELQIAIEYIQAIKQEILDARGLDEMHLAKMSMIRDCPNINNNRILLTDEQRTYLAMKRKIL